jgi:hypothetical protein
MFWNKLRVVTISMVVGALLAGTAFFAYRSSGLQTGSPPAPQPGAQAKDAATIKAGPIVSSSADAPPLGPNAKARLDVAKKLRDQMWEVVRIDPTRDFTESLTWLNRYHEVVEAVLVKTEVDRVRFLEHRVATLKRTEDYVRRIFEGTRQIAPYHVLAVELYRLEAEDRLENTRATLPPRGHPMWSDTVSSPLLQFLNQDSWSPDRLRSQGPQPAAKSYRRP